LVKGGYDGLGGIKVVERARVSIYQSVRKKTLGISTILCISGVQIATTSRNHFELFQPVYAYFY
jgi:hypothetical protein